jgi:hypothetical protein
MREKLNSDPLYQAAAVGVLLLVAGFFLLSTMGGKKEEAEEAESGAGLSSLAVAEGEPATPPPPGALAETAPPPPAPVAAAFAANRTIVLLFVRNGGIDDRMVKADVERLNGLAGVATFVVPADQIARYASITQGVDVNRVPALVVVRPKHLDQGTPTASVHNGYQSPQSVVQAVVDAGYRGHTLAYHP